MKYDQTLFTVLKNQLPQDLAKDNFPAKIVYKLLIINVTSFSSYSYCSNSEHWSQKRAQSGNIHSIILDVYVERQSAQKFPFLQQQNHTWFIWENNTGIR